PLPGRLPEGGPGGAQDRGLRPGRRPARVRAVRPADHRRCVRVLPDGRAGPPEGGIQGREVRAPAGGGDRMTRPGFFDRLREASRARGSLLCVGLDPEPDRIPGGAAGALRHCADVVERTAEHACCYKPNAAFWEQYGPDGWKALLDLRDTIP